MFRELSKRVRTMDKWLPKGIPGASASPPRVAQQSVTHQRQVSGREAGPHQSDSAFERFLTAAIATIITIMFSWRMLDQSSKPASSLSSSSSLLPLPAGRKQTEDEEDEEERRRRREIYLRGGPTSDNLFTASSSPPLSSSHQSSSPFADRAGSNTSPVSSSSSSSTLTNSTRRRQLPIIPGPYQSGDTITSPSSSAAATTSLSPTSTSRFQKQQDESLAARLAKISSSTSVRGRTSGPSGVGFRLTNLSPVIRVPVDDFPLCGDADQEADTSQVGDGKSPKQLERQDTPHPNTKNTGVISETYVDPKQLTALGIDPWSMSKPPADTTNRVCSRKGPVLYTDLDADSSEELVDSSLEDAEAAAGMGDTVTPGDNKSNSAGPRRDLLLNISTDSDSSGGIITKEDEAQEEILDPKQFHTVMTAKLREEEEDSLTERQLPMRIRSMEDDRAKEVDEDEFFVVPGDSAYLHHYSGQRTTTSNNISALGGDSDYHGDSSRGGIMGFQSYYYDDEDEEDDVQPRELDSDEELYLCSVLEPIIEENSDELSPSSGGESYSSTSSSSRSGFRTRHQQHDYDVDYYERKHGLIPDTAIPGNSNNFLFSENYSIPDREQGGSSVHQDNRFSLPNENAENPISLSLNSSNNVHSKSRPEDSVLGRDAIQGDGEDRELNYISNDSLIVGIKAKYSIPTNSARPSLFGASDDPGEMTSDLPQGAGLHSPSPASARLSDSARSADVTEATARAGGQVGREDSLNRDGEGGDTTAQRGATGPDTTIRGDTHTPSTLPRDRRGWGGGAASLGADYNESRPGSGDARMVDPGSFGFTQHTYNPPASAEFTTTTSGSRSRSAVTEPSHGDDFSFTLEPFASEHSGNGFIRSLNTNDPRESDYRNRPAYTSKFSSSGGNEVNIRSFSDVIENKENKDNNNKQDLVTSDSSTSSSSSSGDKTISYNFYSDVSSGVYSSRIIITGEKEEEVIKPPTYEDSDEDSGEKNQDSNLKQSETTYCDQLSVSFPSDTDYYEYLRCYGSSVDLDSPSSPHPPNSPVDSGKVSEPALGRRSENSPRYSRSGLPQGKFRGKQGDENLWIESQHSDDPLADSGANSPTGGEEEKGGGVSRAAFKRQDHTFARTFSTRVDHDSNSESDESVQTVISRKGLKLSDPATASSSAGSSLHASPEHVKSTATDTLSPAFGTRPKRPLSDGCVYSATKVFREDESKDAFFRDRIVSEGGGVAFGEDGIADDRFEGVSEYDRRDSGEENGRLEGLRAYKSYSSLHTKGLDLYSDEERDNRLGVFSDSECSSPSSPHTPQTDHQFVSSTDPIAFSGSQEAADTFSEGENVEADVIKETTVTFDGSDCLTFVVNPQGIPDSAMNRRRFRLSREEEEATRYGAQPDYGNRRVPEISESERRAQQGDDDDDDEWEQSITETFVVPVTPERTIYQTLQNVKHLLDTRSPSIEQDETASTCRTTMVEADGRNIGGFIGHDDVTSGYRASSDALESVDARLKERLGFQLSMDELRSEGYSTESGWPIVRYIEKERVFVEEHGQEGLDGSSVDAEDRMKEGEDSGDEYVPDYTDIDADYDPAAYDEPEERMDEGQAIPRLSEPLNDGYTERYPSTNYAQSYAPPMPWDQMTTTAPSYKSPPSVVAPPPAATHSPSSPEPGRGLPTPRPGRLGSSRSNLPPPPPPPTQVQVPEERYNAPRRSEIHMTRPLYSDIHSPPMSMDAKKPSLPRVPPNSQSRIALPSPIYPSGPQPSLLPEEEDFAYLPSDGISHVKTLSPESIPVHHSMSPSVPSEKHSTFPLLDTPPRVIRPASPHPPETNEPNEPPVEPHGDPRDVYGQGDEGRDESYSSDGSDTRGRPPAEFADFYRAGEAGDGDEDYDYFVKHIADGEPDIPQILASGNLKTPLSASGGAGIPILSGNLASPNPNRDVFLFPSEGSIPDPTKLPSSKTHSSPSLVPASAKDKEEDRIDAAKEDSVGVDKRGVGEDMAPPEMDEYEDKSSAKKPQLIRTSTGTEAMEGFFSAPRRSSAASILDDESSNALNKSFGEPTNSSLSFALERYDSEPGIRSPTKEKFAGSSSPFRESPIRMSSRPMSVISQEPSLYVVIEAGVDTPATMSSASSTASDVTVIAAESPESPSSPSRVVSLEQSPSLMAPPPQLPLSLPPDSLVKVIEEVEEDTPFTPGESETLVLSEMEQRWDNSMKRTKKNKMDLPFADDEDTLDNKDSAASLSPLVERDQIAQLAQKSPKILPIFAEKQKDQALSGDFQGGEDEKGQAIEVEDRENKDLDDTESDETEDDEEDSESESESDTLNARAKEVEDSIRNVKDVRPVSLLSQPQGIRPISFQDHRRIPLRAGSNSVESLDENYPAESPPSSGPMSPGISSDSASAVEASPSSTKPYDGSSLATPPLHSTSRPMSSRLAASSPSGLSTLTQTSPLCIPFPGTAWAHAQFGQYDKPPKGPQPTTPKRSMKEVKRMSKAPYKSVLTQNPPLTFTTPPSPSPKAAAFVLPDTMLTPSRLKILNSRHRFLSEGSIQNAADDYKNEFAAHKESLLQSQGDMSNSEIPFSSRLHATKSPSDSFNAKNWRYRSMEQLQKLQEMSKLTRKSESDLSHKLKDRHDCLHADCIFSEKGRREVLDKTLSIDNLHADVYKHLRRLGGSEADAGDAYFPENSSDFIDLNFDNFQNDGKGSDTFDRPHSMSELRHASDYSTISGSSGGYFSTPSSARHPASKGGRFAQHKQYKKSKSLCTLETDIDDDSFGPTSPISPSGDELGMQRAPSAHDLRISKSLQKLNVPQWYSQSSLSKYGSLSLLKYGSNSTMSSWQQLPSSIISSPCTTPSASGNVVIKARVQPPTSARNLRSPRFPSKSAPTTPLFGSNGQANRSGESSSVKLPSDKLRKKEKAKALMPIPIVPFDKIRAMFEKKKSEDMASKQAVTATPVSPTSPVSPASPATTSPTVVSPISFSPPPTATSPSHQPPRTLSINGRRDPRDDDDDVYEDVEIVVPKVIVSPTEPHVKGILKRPSQSEKRYSDIQEDPEDEEPPLPKPVPTRPVEAAPTMRQTHAPAVSAPPQAQSPVSEPQVEYFFNRQEDRLVSAPPSIQQPSKQAPAQPKLFEQTSSPPNGEKREDSSPKPPTPKPRGGGFSFFKKKLSPSSSSSSEKGGKKSPSSPANSSSPNTSYDSADKFPAVTVSSNLPGPQARISGYNDPESSFPASSSHPPSRPAEAMVRLEEAPVMRPPPTVTFPDEDIRTGPNNHDVFPASSSTLALRPEPRGHVQETNIDDSSEGSAPTSPTHVSAPHHPHPYQLHQQQAPPEPPSSSPPPLATPSPPAPETKPEKKRTWFPKPGKSRKASKSPASAERALPDLPSPQSPKSPIPPPGFQVGEMSYEPRRLRSSRSSGLDESFTSEGSRSLAGRGGRDQDRSLSSTGRPDLERSRDSFRPSRPTDLERKSSVDSDRSFSRDLDRVSGRAAARAAPLDLDRSGGASSSGGDKRELSFRERRDRDMRRYEPDVDDHEAARRDKNLRDPYGRDSDSDRRDRNSSDKSRDRDSRGGREDPRRYDMDSSASLAPRDRRSRELPDVSNTDMLPRRSVDHVDIAISRADRKPYVVEEVPKIRTWQPKPRTGRQQQDSSAPANVPAPVPNSNGTASRNYRYPVSGSAFSASKPNQASGLNTPPMSRHAQPTAAAAAAATATANSAPEDAAKKDVRGER